MALMIKINEVNNGWIVLTGEASAKGDTVNSKYVFTNRESLITHIEKQLDIRAKKLNEKGPNTGGVAQAEES